MLLYYVSKDFSVENLRKTGLYGYIYDFELNSVDVFDSWCIDVDDVLDIHKYLMKNYDIK